MQQWQCSSPKKAKLSGFQETKTGKNPKRNSRDYKDAKNEWSSNWEIKKKTHNKGLKSMVHAFRMIGAVESFS